MIFATTCIVTENITLLMLFYRQILRIEPSMHGEEYVEFHTEGGKLSLFTLYGQELLAPGSVQPAFNRSVMLEFRVDDVDSEYERLQELEIEWVKPLTTQAWGSRSVYFRDPDGNLLSFYSRV